MAHEASYGKHGLCWYCKLDSKNFCFTSWSEPSWRLPISWSQISWSQYHVSDWVQQYKTKFLGTGTFRKHNIQAGIWLLLKAFMVRTFWKITKTYKWWGMSLMMLKVVDHKKVYKTYIVCSSHQKHHFIFIHERTRRSFESKIPPINLLTCKYMERKRF